MRIPRVVRTASVAAAIATFALAGLAAATHPGGYSLFGDAHYVSPGNASNRAVEISSDVTGANYGGIDFALEGPMTFAQLEQLSTDYMPEVDDPCLGGSPRFAIGLDGPDGDSDVDGYIFSYFGIDSAGVPCVPGIWQNTGDQLEVTRLVDATQLGGAFYEPYAVALAAYGSYAVSEVFIVIDGSWAQLDSEQTFRIDNTNVDGHLYTYEAGSPTKKADCKDGGWMELVDDEGNAFKNQGQCVSSVSSGKG